MDYKDKILFGDALEQLKTISDETVQMCVTSPPYWGLRDYGVDGQLGLEETPEEYVENITKVFCEVRRVLKEDGTLWLNIGDSYSGSNSTRDSVVNNDSKSATAGHTKSGVKKSVNSKVKGLKPKDMVMIPARTAMSLQSDGWYLRSDIIWHKPNPMPESVTDRPTKSHEYIFLLSKSPKYYYDYEAIKEPLSESSINRLSQNLSSQNGSKRANGGKKDNGNMKAVGSKDGRNKRSVWSINTNPFSEAHFAVYPPELIAPCIKAGSKPYDIVLDPFFGSGTTGEVCQKLNRHYLGIELNEDYGEIQGRRLNQKSLQFK